MCTLRPSVSRAASLFRARRHRPCHRAADETDELAPSHVTLLQKCAISRSFLSLIMCTGGT
jgi:hypothetical protein